MLKRTLFFSNPCHLSVQYEQLKIANKETGEETQAPVEDLGYVILDHPQITFTQSVMQKLSANNTAVVFCDEKHHPTSLLFHLDTHYVQSERFRHQVQASEPLKKQLWQQTIKAKLNNQAKMLEYTGCSGEALQYLVKEVKSGDSTNREAQASRHYWPQLFGDNFTRERYGVPPNAFLNYGYAILRAAVARALVGSGLLPTLGIHHRNKYNAYCLADDIMEPFRPFVDRCVWHIAQDKPDQNTLTKEDKATLLSILNADVNMNNNTRPLMIALNYTTASLAKCFEGKQKKVQYPELIS